MPTQGQTVTATSSMTAGTRFRGARTTASIAHCRRCPRSEEIRPCRPRGIQTCCPTAQSTAVAVSAAVYSERPIGWVTQSGQSRQGCRSHTDSQSFISGFPTWVRARQRWWSMSGTRGISRPASRCIIPTVDPSSKARMRQLWSTRRMRLALCGGTRRCGPLLITHRPP